MGFGARSCMVFCYLNAACAMLISYFFRIGIASMAITSTVNKWDRQEKARTIFKASILYLILAVSLTIKDVLDTRREREMSGGDVRQRAADYGLDFSTGTDVEVTPLIDRRRGSRSDGSQSGNSTGRRYGATS